MILISMYIVLSIIKTSELNPNTTLQEENSIKNGHLNSNKLSVTPSETDQLEIRTPITPVMIFPPGPVNFEQELVKLKGFAKLIDPCGNKLLNPDEFKVEFEKLKDLNVHIKPNEPQICDHKEIINELTRLQKFIKFINRDGCAPINPSIVDNEIEKLIEIGKFVNPEGPLCIRSNTVIKFLDKLTNLLEIFDQSEDKNLNFKNVFDIFERVTELYSIFNSEGKQNFNGNNPVFDFFRKFTQEKSEFCLKFSNKEIFEENLQVELKTFLDENLKKQPKNSLDDKQTLKKLNNLVKFLKLCDIKTLNTEEYKKVLNMELDRLKKISQFMDPNNVKDLNIDSFGQELEKYMDLAELIKKSDPPILNYDDVESKLLRLQKFSEIINPCETKLLEHGLVEKQLEKFHKLSQIIAQKELQDIKTDEITNELERLNGVGEIFDFNHKTLSFDQIKRELNRLSNLVKVIDPNQPQLFNSKEVGDKLKKYIASPNFIAMKQTPISDGNGPEKAEGLNTVEKIQTDSPSTVTKENLQKIMDKEKQPELEKSFSKTLVKDFQSTSDKFGGLNTPVMSENLDYNKIQGSRPVNYQGDDPNAYTFLDKDTSRVVNQPKDIKKSIEKLKELYKTIKSEIETYKTVGVKIDLPEEVKKLINLSEVELFKPDDLEKKIEIFYKFAERLKKDLSSNTRRREEEHENLERLQNRNTTRILNFEDGISEQEVYHFSNKKHKKTINNRVSNSKDGQHEHEKSLKRTKSSRESKDKRIDRPSKSQNLQHFVNEKNNREHRGVKLNYGDNDQSKISKISNKKLQSTTNVPDKNDLQDDEIEESDQQYGDDPNAYNSAEIGTKLVENNANVLLYNTENSQSSKQESIFYTPKKLLSAGNHEEISIVGKSHDDKSKVYGEKNELHSQNERGYQKNIRKVEVGELDINITLHFTFSRSLC